LGVTLNTAVQGAWALLLAAHSGEQDVAFGTVLSGRPADLAGVESIVGLFVNTLPLRVRMAPEMAVGPWLRILQDHLVDLRQHEWTPLVAAQGWSEVSAGQPLFHSLLAFENYPLDRSLGARLGASVEIGEVASSQRTNYPLTVTAAPDGPLKLQMYFDAHFEPVTIQRLLSHLATLLVDLSLAPERHLSELSPLTTEERFQLLTVWNDTAVEWPQADSLHRLIEAQVARSPAAVAVSCEGESLTYRELDRRAGLLAAKLRSLGVAIDGVVGICAERSLEMVVALFATLKAGGAYLPLDPGYPQERLTFMLEDARPAVLLVQERLARRVAASANGTTRMV